MRTSININDRLYMEAKKLADETHKTFAKVVEDALRSSIAIRNAKNKNKVSLMTTGEGGLVHGVDLDDSASLNDLME